MTVSPDMRRNLKELTKMINNLNKIIKDLIKINHEKVMEGKDDPSLIKVLTKKQKMLHDVYVKYNGLVEQVSPNDVIPVPLSPTSSASSSSSSSGSRRTRRNSRSRGGRKTRRQRK